MADGLVSVKEHEDILETRRQAESPISIKGKRINMDSSVGKIPSLFSVRQEVCWLDRVWEGGAKRELSHCLLVCSAGFLTSFLAVKFCHGQSALLQVVRSGMGSRLSELLRRGSLA